MVGSTPLNEQVLWCGRRYLHVRDAKIWGWLARKRVWKKYSGDENDIARCRHREMVRARVSQHPFPQPTNERGGDVSPAIGSAGVLCPPEWATTEPTPVLGDTVDVLYVARRSHINPLHVNNPRVQSYRNQATGGRIFFWLADPKSRRSGPQQTLLGSVGLLGTSIPLA